MGVMTAGKSASKTGRQLRRERPALVAYRGALLTAAVTVFGLRLLDVPLGWAILAGGFIAFWMSLRIYAERYHSDEGRTWKLGARGERTTARRLHLFVWKRRFVNGERWHLFHDLAFPGSDANLDHVLVGPRGLVTGDSKKWELPWSYFQGLVVYQGKEVDTGPTAWEARELSKVVSQALERPIEVFAFWSVVRWGPLPFEAMEVNGVTITHLRNVRKVLLGQPVVYTPREVEEIVRAVRANLRQAK